MLQDLSKYPRIRISRLNKLVTFSVSKAFQDQGYAVSNEQEVILRSLRNFGKMSITELSGYTGQDRHNLSRTLALLERKGYVRKVSSEIDKRYCEVTITPEGEAVHERLWQILEDWRKKTFAGISLEDLEQFSKTAEAIMNNIKQEYQ